MLAGIIVLFLLFVVGVPAFVGFMLLDRWRDQGELHLTKRQKFTLAACAAPMILFTLLLAIYMILIIIAL